MSITEAESVLMEVLWAESPLSSEDIIARVAGRQDWRDVTVRTLLNRLLKKGAVGAEREGRRYLYRPLIDRSAYLAMQSRAFVDRLFGGRLAPLVTHFSEHNELTKEDVADLKRLLKELGHGS